MSILGIVLHNFTRRSRTRAPEDTTPIPTGFHGLIEHQTDLCVGCGTCAYVCSPGAIRLEEQANHRIAWKFFAGQCAYCGLCVQYCPTKAITNSGKQPPVSIRQSEHRVAHDIPYRACASCGASVIPLPQAVLHDLYGDTLTDTVLAEQALCPQCRRRLAGERLRESYSRSRQSLPSQERDHAS